MSVTGAARGPFLTTAVRVGIATPCNSTTE
jgi:hypothetical protein